MPKFQVTVDRTQTSHAVLTVEADDEDAATAKVQDIISNNRGSELAELEKIYGCDWELDDDEFEVGDVEEGDED